MLQNQLGRRDDLVHVKESLLLDGLRHPFVEVYWFKKTKCNTDGGRETNNRLWRHSNWTNGHGSVSKLSKTADEVSRSTGWECQRGGVQKFLTPEWKHH